MWCALFGCSHNCLTEVVLVVQTCYLNGLWCICVCVWLKRICLVMGLGRKNPNGRELLTGFEHWYSLCYKKSLPAGLVCVCVCVCVCVWVRVHMWCVLFVFTILYGLWLYEKPIVAVIDGWWSYTPLYPSLQPQFYTSTWPTAGTLL